MTGSPLTIAAKNIRAELTRQYPETLFSVRSRRYAGGDSISVVWTDGPTPQEVEPLMRKYEQGTFNGTTDSYEFDEDPQHKEFHRLRGSTRYVMLQRRGKRN